MTVSARNARSPEVGGLYTASQDFADLETKRLVLMDRWLNGVSMNALGPKPGRVLDVGCGSGQLLEQSVRRDAGHYIAIDSAMAMIRTRRETAPSTSFVADAAWLPFRNYCDQPGDGRIDATHARAVTSWLSPATRARYYEESIRVASRSVIINFDWTPGAEVAPATRAFISFFSSILSNLGYDAEYAKRQHQDIRSRLDSSYTVATTDVCGEVGDDLEARMIMEGAVTSIASELRRAEAHTPYAIWSSLYSRAMDSLDPDYFWLPRLYVTSIERT